MNENVKWKYEPYAYYNKTAIEEHLTEMAKEGWIIENMGCLWKYQKIEPVNRAFEVVYFPELDQTKGDLTPEQREYKEQLDTLLASRNEAGWTLALVHKKMLVFCRDGAKEASTKEENLQALDDIKKAANEGRIGILLTCSLLAITNGLRLSEEPLYTLMSMEGIIWLMVIGVLLWNICSIISVKLWYKKAKSQVESWSGIPSKKEHFVSLNGIEIVPMIVVFILFFLQSDVLIGKLASIVLLVTFLIILPWSEWAVDRTTYKRLMGIKDRNIGFWSNVVFVIIAVACTISVVASDGDWYDSPKNDAPLLKMEAVHDYEDDGVYYHEDYETFFARTERWEFAPGACYYAKIKKPAFYDIVLKLFCEDEDFQMETAEELDPIPWGAEHVYYDGEKYVALWEDVILSILFFDEPTAEQIAVIKEEMSK